MLTTSLLSEVASSKKQYAGEQRNLFPQLIDYFEKNREEVQGLVDLVNSDLKKYRYPENTLLNYESFRQKAILAVLHRAPKKIDDEVMNKEIDSIINPISKKINSAEPNPVLASSAERRFKKLQADLPISVKEIVGKAFELNNLEEVAWDLCTSLDKVFSAMRFFERKMLNDQAKPIAREFSKKLVAGDDWSSLTPTDKEALICEFAGFHRDDTAKHLGVTNRTLTNRFLNIRNHTGLERESFDQIKRRQALVNVDRQKLIDDRLVNFVFNKSELEANENKTKSQNPFYVALMSLTHTDMVAKIKEALDLLPDKFRKPVLDYINDDDIHTNSLTGKSIARTLHFARTNTRKILKPMLLEQIPDGLKASQWAHFKSVKVRSAMRLYLQGHKRQEIEKMMSQDIAVETFWNWKQAFMEEFGFDKESFTKLRLRNKITRLKTNKKAYRKRAFDIVFPKGALKPKKLKSESPDAYYERILSLTTRFAPSYSRKETYSYFKYRIIGLSANELGSMFGLHKSSAMTSIKNFANFIRTRISELEKSSAPETVDPIQWLHIKEDQRPIMESYLSLKQHSSSNLYLSLEEQFPQYSIQQLQAITHQGRQKLGMRLIEKKGA